MPPRAAPLPSSSPVSGFAADPRHPLRDARAQPDRRARHRVPLAALVILTALIASGCGAGHTATPPGPGAGTAASSAQRALAGKLGLGDPGPRVGRDFLGLSFEAGDLGLLARATSEGNLIALLRSLGPGVLRLGGSSADADAAWTSVAQSRPAWAATAVTPADLTSIARLSKATGWGVLLTVNLGHYDPAAAAAEVRAARAALGRRLLAVEIGNEPEHFIAHGLRGSTWSSRAYRVQVDAYRTAIAGASPGVALAGPDAVSLFGSLGWIQREATWEHPTLLTAHYYPLGRCSAYRPSIADLLSSTVRRAETQMLVLADTVQRRTGTPLRVDETNNVACGGQPGVSDTFGAALWAIDYIGRAMASDVQGINLHGLVAEPSGYAPLAFASPAARLAGRLSARPEFYALLLAAHLVGDRALRGMPTPAGLDGSVREFIRPDGGVDVLAVDEAPAGSSAVVVHLRLPDRFAVATALRLTAPAPGSRADVRLGGRSVAADGTFRGAPSIVPVPAHAGRLSVDVAPDSAALITLRVHAPAAR